MKIEYKKLNREDLKIGQKVLIISPSGLYTVVFVRETHYINTCGVSYFKNKGSIYGIQYEYLYELKRDNNKINLPLDCIKEVKPFCNIIRNYLQMKYRSDNEQAITDWF